MKGLKMVITYQENPYSNPKVRLIEWVGEWQQHMDLFNKVEPGMGDFNPDIKTVSLNCIQTDILCSY